jgi:DNA-binding response OmpR family regulator
VFLVRDNSGAATRPPFFASAAAQSAGSGRFRAPLWSNKRLFPGWTGLSGSGCSLDFSSILVGWQMSCVSYHSECMAETILIVEDEADVVDLLRYNLARAGFSVLIARDGVKGIEMARQNRPELIVLDLMLPAMDGYAVCRTLRKDPEMGAVPILILTARGQPSERIRGLELGADDYLTKPFSPRELVLRVQALLRRSRSHSQPEVLEVGQFQLNKSRFDVRLEGRRLDLSATEFKLLCVLIERRGRTQSRETLLSDVWGYQNPIDTRTVDTHIRRLREKLGRHASRLETVYGEGYCFKTTLEH